MKYLECLAGLAVGVAIAVGPHLLQDWRYDRAQFWHCVTVAVIQLAGLVCGVVFILNFRRLVDAWHALILRRALRESRSR